MIYLNNNTEVQEIFIPRQTVLGGGYIATTKTYEDGLMEGIERGKEIQKDQLLNLYVTENGQYEREDGWGVVTVDVPTEGGDCSEAYDKGFEDGYNQGQSECEEVDCSGAYNEGYDKGKNDGYDSGYQDGYNQGQNDCPSEGGCNLEDKWVTPSMGEMDDNGHIVVEEDEGYDGLARVVINPSTIYNEGIEEGRNQGGGSGDCNLEDKWVTPSMDERDGNGLIVVYPSEGFDGMRRTVIDPQTIYNEGVEAGKAEGGEGGSCNLGILDLTLTDPYTVVKDASEDGYDGYNQVIVRPDNIIAQQKEEAINEFKNKMEEITITENGTYSIDDTELLKSIAFDGNSYFDTGIVPTENIKIEVCIKVIDGIDCGMGGIIIGGGIAPVDSQNYNGNENRGIAIGMGGGAIYGVWGAARSWNNPYECEGTTTVVLEKTDDSWTWESEKGSFGASTLYIGGYNMNGEEVEEKFTQSIVYIKIWTDRNDDSTLITYIPNTNGNFDANGVELQRLGDGTTTYVEENVNTYPYGFKRVEVNVPSYETAIRNFYWCPVIVEDAGFGERAKSFTLATDAIMLDTDRNNLNPQTQMLYIPRSDNQNTIMTTKKVTAIGNFPFEGSDAPYVGKIKVESGVTTFGCENVDMSGLYALELGESINSIVLRNCNTRNLNKIIVHSNLNCDIYFTYTATEGVVYVNEDNPFRATWENALGSGWTIEYL